MPEVTALTEDEIRRGVEVTRKTGFDPDKQNWEERRIDINGHRVLSLILMKTIVTLWLQLHPEDEGVSC